jgi:hypothetical protein
MSSLYSYKDKSFYSVVHLLSVIRPGSSYEQDQNMIGNPIIPWLYRVIHKSAKYFENLQ